MINGTVEIRFRAGLKVDLRSCLLCYYASLILHVDLSPVQDVGENREGGNFDYSSSSVKFHRSLRN